MDFIDATQNNPIQANIDLDDDNDSDPEENDPEETQPLFRTSCWRSKYLANWTPVWKFKPLSTKNALTDNGLHYIFAPGEVPAGKQLPLYLKIEINDSNSKLFGADQLDSDCYVSLFAIIALGMGATEDPTKVAETEDEAQQERRKRNWPRIEDAFLEDWNKHWEPDTTVTRQELPVRKQNGSLDSLLLCDDWQTVWGEFLQTKLGAKAKVDGAGKPIRHLEIKLEKPLMVLPLTRHRDMIETRFPSPGGYLQFFQSAVEQVNQQVIDEAAINNTEIPWQLDLTQNKNILNYIPLSKDPFDLYETLIHVDDWNAYMQGLSKKGISPVRKFPRIKEVFDFSEKILVNVGAKDMRLQRKLGDQVTEVPKNEISIEEEKPEGTEISIEKDKAMEEEVPNRPFYELGLKRTDNPTDEDLSLLPARRGKAPTDEQNKKREESAYALNWCYNRYEGMTDLEVDLDWRKMDNASGKRGGEAGQQAVMGNVSASDIAGMMGWPAGRMATGLVAAEWLHLSAFSWGGFADASDENGYFTSQNVENLVFGTSETNSIMTRYEMAWQRLFRSEKEIRNNQTTDIAGTLHIACNDFSAPIIYDSQTGTKFEAKVLEEFTVDERKILGTQQLARHFKLHPNDDTSNVIPQAPPGRGAQHTRDNTTTRTQMLALANDFPFIVYSIKYTLDTAFTSLVFGSRMKNEFMFYPFRREFFHRAEYLLDDILFTQFEEKAKAHEQQMRKEMDEIIMKRSKSKRVFTLVEDMEQRLLKGQNWLSKSIAASNVQGVL
ncbi:hypothetical protein NM208_g826 [Fusarium decemcellulare]|uniref:Uncharacterized protein n=1 Tax=Fusarium decemcellulare TaxID=57161 RepID=A0ACC1SYI7_9HYPO|nr:hypothetical protein NM208_g826 [Fusarium decemcellulare]